MQGPRAVALSSFTVLFLLPALFSKMTILAIIVIGTIIYYSSILLVFNITFASTIAVRAGAISIIAVRSLVIYSTA